MSGSARCRGNWNATRQREEEMLCMQPVRKSGVAKHRRKALAILRTSICVVDYPSRGGVSSRPGRGAALMTADPRMTHQLEQGGST